MFQLEDYDYILPPELIAQTPAHPADSCKLLVYNKTTGQLTDMIFRELPTLLDPQTLIIFNTSKVLPARLPLTFSSGSGEIFYLTAHDAYTFDALVRPGKKFRVNDQIIFNENISFTVETITSEGRRLRCSQPILDVLTTYGEMPLPPYISYDPSKAAPYQPIFAQQPGSVASPTASLHFTQQLLDQLAAKGVSHYNTVLHVGLGTFKQVDTTDITQYKIHSETIELPLDVFSTLATAILSNKKILAVGTTVARTLETIPYLRRQLTDVQKSLYDPPIINRWDQFTSDISLEQAKIYAHHITYEPTKERFLLASSIYIYPGFAFRLVNQLITNFHLPKSSLLMLVAGFMGYHEMKKLYQHAIEHQYKFYSFGDATLIH